MTKSSIPIADTRDLMSSDGCSDPDVRSELPVDDDFMKEFVLAMESSDVDGKLVFPSPVLANGKPIQRRTYGQTRVSEEHKRERNRETFKRFYHRKQQTLRELRSEEQSLNLQCKNLVASGVSADASCSMHSSYIGITAQKYKLLEENLQLGELLARRLKQQSTIRRLIDSRDKFESTDQRRRFEYLRSTAPINRRRDVDAGVKLLTEIQDSFRDNSHSKQAFGWTCRWRGQSGWIDLHLRKSFPTNELAIDLIVASAWQFCTSEILPTPGDTNGVRPSSVLRTRRHAIQHDGQSATSCLIYRTVSPASSVMQSPPTALELRSLYFVSKFTQDGDRPNVTILSQSVPAQEIASVVDASPVFDRDPFEWNHQRDLIGGIRRQWVDELSMWQIDQTKTKCALQPIEVAFTGRVPVHSELSEDCLLTEALRTAVEWETVVLRKDPIVCTN